MKIKRVNEMNETSDLNKSLSFNTPQELLEHVDNLDLGLSRAKSRFSKIINNESFDTTLKIVNIDNLSTKLDSKVSIVENLTTEVRKFISDMNNEYKENPNMDDPKGDEIHSQLENTLTDLGMIIENLLNYKHLLDDLVDNLSAVEHITDDIIGYKFNQ